jgi:hypothetical protein
MSLDSLVLTKPTRSYDGSATLSTCKILIPGRSPEELWIRTSGEGFVDSNDSFVAVSLLTAMKLGVPLVSEGPVSRTLLESGLPAIQRIYSVWRDDIWSHTEPKRFHVVEIDAPVVEDMPSAPGGVGLFFSSGVDSSFSLAEAREEVTALIFLRDFEGRFSPEGAHRAFSGVTNVAQAFDKGVITVETNAKWIFSKYVSWLHFHGQLLSAIALQLQGRLAKVRMPATYDIRTLQPWGSHPYLDPLWSTGAIQIVHDRIDVTRLEKLARIARDRVLLENLRVCGLPQQNCGLCEKCVRTMFALQALDLFEEGAPFNRSALTPREIARLDWRHREYPEYIEEIVNYLIDSGGHPELVEAARIAHSGRYYRGVGKLLRGNLGPRVKARVWRRLGRVVY